MTGAVINRRVSAVPMIEPDREAPLPVSIKTCWGLGAFGVAILSNAASGLIIYYLGKIVGMPLWLAGALLSLTRIIDAIIDPLMGWVSDRTPDRFGGRRRPYLLAGAIMSTLSMLLLFNVPFRGDSWVTTAWVLFVLIFYGLAYSMFNVPFIAMSAEMTGGYHERSSIHGYRVIFSGIGIAIALSGSGLLLAWLSHGRKVGGVQVNTAGDYAMMSAAFAGLILTSMLVAWRGTRTAPMTLRTITQLPWRAQVGSFFGNKPFMTIMGVKALQLIAVQSNQAAQFFMMVEVLKRSSGQVALYGLPMLATSIVVTPLLVAFSRRFGKRISYAMSSVFVSVSYLSWVLATPGEPVWALTLRGFLTGIGFAGGVMFAMSMITDAIELDTHRTGLRREAMFTAVFSFVEKFAGAAGPIIVGAALSFVGFSAKMDITTENYAAVRQATLVGVAYLPALCSLLSALLLFYYKLSAADLQAARAQSLVDRPQGIARSDAAAAADRAGGSDSALP